MKNTTLPSSYAQATGLYSSKESPLSLHGKVTTCLSSPRFHGRSHKNGLRYRAHAHNVGFAALFKFCGATNLTSKLLGSMAEGDDKLTVQGSKEKVVKVAPEDYTISTRECTALKVICLGDSAVGKSKYVVLIKEHHNKPCLLCLSQVNRAVPCRAIVSS